MGGSLIACASVLKLVRIVHKIGKKINRPIVAAKKHRELVEVLLKHGADINARSDWWAGSFGVLDGVDRETFDFLVARGATPNIHAYSAQGMADEVRDCLQQDPTLANARGGDGQTPLHVAVLK